MGGGNVRLHLLRKDPKNLLLLGHTALGRGKLLETGISVDMRGAPKCILR